MPYGTELIIDMKGCDVSQFNREALEEYFIQLCKLIDMEREDLHFWDDEGVPDHLKRTEPHIVGISAVQFILTSNVTIHALTILKEAYVNIFSCKYFDAGVALNFTRRWFSAEEFTSQVAKRGDWGKPPSLGMRDIQFEKGEYI